MCYNSADFIFYSKALHEISDEESWDIMWDLYAPLSLTVLFLIRRAQTRKWNKIFVQGAVPYPYISPGRWTGKCNKTNRWRNRKMQQEHATRRMQQGEWSKWETTSGRLNNYSRENQTWYWTKLGDRPSVSSNRNAIQKSTTSLGIFNEKGERTTLNIRDWRFYW